MQHTERAKLNVEIICQRNQFKYLLIKLLSSIKK